MNRQCKRLMKKEEERKRGASRPSPKPTGAPTKKERTPPRQFLKEVAAEMRKVSWASRAEVFSYSLVVLVATVIIAAAIFGMDYVFTRAILTLFGVEV